MTKGIAVIVSVAVLCMVIAGGNATTAEETKAVKVESTTPDMAEGKKTFEINCVTCHGPIGKGDGVAAVALDPKPRDLSNLEFMKSLEDAYMVKLLKGGGAAVGKSPLMPALGASMTGTQLANLIAYVRTLAVEDEKAVEGEEAAGGEEAAETE